MCRLLAYLGAQPTSLDRLIRAPEHSLLRQSYEPRMQRYGRINADGFGVAWYDASIQQEPARYRRAVPMWGDLSFASIAPMIRSTAILAAVRSATPPFPIEETGCAPFVAQRWSFAHNGAVADFTRGIGMRLRAELTPERAQGVLGATDSEVLFAMILDRMDAGEDPAQALVGTIARVESIATGRFNFVLTDGARAFATRSGDTLFVVRDRVRDGSIVVASEPFDDQPGWEEVPDRSVVEVADGEMKVRPM